MGSGVSAEISTAVQAEIVKPVDASDLTDFETAKAEVVRLRALAKKLGQPGGDAAGGGQVLASADSTTTFDASNVDSVLEEIKFKLYQHWASTRTAFLKFDKDRNGTVSRAEFSKQLQNLGFSEEVGTDIDGLMEEFDKDKNGVVSYNEFFVAVEGAMLPTFEMHKVEAKKAAAAKQGGAEAAAAAEAEKAAPPAATASQLATKVGEKVLEKYNSFRKSFLSADTDRSGGVEKPELSKILSSEIGIPDAQLGSSCDTLFEKFDPNKDGKFQYHEFCGLLQLAEGESQGLVAKIEAMHSNA